jgi:hypothetical protein
MFHCIGSEMISAFQISPDLRLPRLKEQYCLFMSEIPISAVSGSLAAQAVGGYTTA